MKLKIGIVDLIKEAESKIELVSVEELENLMEFDNITIVDIRDIRELWAEGKIPGSIHAPRGMIEFWVDPESPYHRNIFSNGNKFIFYCKSGWRSALTAKTLQDMGFGPLAHLNGGFDDWKNKGKKTERVVKK